MLLTAPSNLLPSKTPCWTSAVTSVPRYLKTFTSSTLGHPSRKDELQIIDNREKARQDDLQKIITQYRSNTIVRHNRDEDIFVLERYK